jgi:hypothetical protein
MSDLVFVLFCLLLTSTVGTIHVLGIDRGRRQILESLIETKPECRHRFLQKMCSHREMTSEYEEDVLLKREGRRYRDVEAFKDFKMDEENLISLDT